MDRTSKFAVVFLCLFALPFAGFGLVALAKGILQVLADPTQLHSWMLPIVGLFFTVSDLGSCLPESTAARS